MQDDRVNIITKIVVHNRLYGDLSPASFHR